MQISDSTSSVTVDENGLRHFVMKADTGHLGVTRSDIEEPIEPTISSDLTDGIYANLAYIRTSVEEVVLDFARIAPNAETPVVKARVVTTRSTALALAKMLIEKLS